MRKVAWKKEGHGIVKCQGQPHRIEILCRTSEGSLIHHFPHLNPPPKSYLKSLQKSVSIIFPHPNHPNHSFLCVSALYEETTSAPNAQAALAPVETFEGSLPLATPLNSVQTSLTPESLLLVILAVSPKLGLIPMRCHVRKWSSSAE